MNSSILSFKKYFRRLATTRYQFWTWSAVLASILICMLVAWLHFEQQQTLNQMTASITTIHRARIELSKGFLYATLADDPNSPFNRDEGIALLQQAAESLNKASSVIGTTFTGYDVTAFQQGLNEFKSRLIDFSSMETSRSGVETDLRIAFHDLETQADEIDQQSEQKLQELASQLNLEFGLTLGGASVLLLGICSVLIYIGRAKEKADIALQEREQKLKRLMEFLPVGLSILDKDRKVVFSNSALQRLLHITQEEFEKEVYLQRSYIARDGSTLQADQFASMQAVRTGQPVHNVEIGVVLEDEETTWLSVSAVPVDFLDWKVIITSTDVTERKKIEEKLRKSEANFVSIFENSPIAIALSRVKDYKITHINEAFANLYGCSREEIIGRTTAELNIWATPADRQYFIEQLQAGRHVRDLETIARLKSGLERNVIVSGEVVNINGEPCLLAQIVDITERKKWETALKASEENYRSLAENSESAIAVLNRDGQVLYCNPWALQTWKSEDLLGKTVFELFPEEYALRYSAAIKQIIDTRTSILDEIETVVNDQIAWYRVSMSPLQNPDGSVNALLLNAWDITERKVAEVKLRQSDERFRQIAETIHEVFWMIDSLEQRIIYVSPAYETIWGRSVQSLYADSRQYIDLILPEDRPLMVAAIEKQALGEPAELEYRITQPDGSIRWIHDRSFPAFAQDGALIRTIGIAADITERKKVEAEAFHRQKLLEKVIQLGKNIAAITELDSCLQEIYRSVRFELGFERVGLFLYDASNSWVRGAYGTTRTGEIVGPGFLESSIKTWKGWQEALGHPTGMSYVDNFQLAFNPPVDNEMYGVGSHVTIAAWAGEKPVALITADNLFTGRPIEPVDLEALQLFAGYVGLAIENASLQTGLERRVQELKQADENAIYRQKLLEQVILLGKKVSAISDLLACLREVHGSIQQSLKFDRVGLFLYDRDTRMVQGVYGTDKNGKIEDTSWYTSSVADWWAWDDALKSPIGISLVEDYQAAINPSPDSDMYGVKQYATMAAWVGDKPVAMIAVDNLITQRVMNAADLEALQFFTGYVGLAIENARLHSGLEQLVKERTAQVQDLYDSAPAGYHSLNKDGVFTQINQTELNWLGYTYEEVVNVKHFSDLLSPNSRERFDKAFPEFLEKGRIKDWEFDLICKDGSVLPALLNSIAIYDSQGNFVHSRSTLLDNTERKEAELALRENEAQLRQSRDELSVAYLSLEKASRAKDEFLANMSHELRTPLSSILGLSEVLQEEIRGPLNESQRKLIDTIQSSGTHLLSLINDILDLSKIEANKFELNLEKVSIGDICRSSLIFIKESATKKGVNVSFEPDPTVSTLRVDVRRLKQILVNLLSNAVKFTPSKGQVTLKVQANLEQNRIHFSVSDTGIGISDEDLQRLFTPFTQVDNSMTRRYEGTGLGLALVKRLTELHGGSLLVVSKPEKGSCFTVSLPWQPDLPSDDLLTLPTPKPLDDQPTVEAVPGSLGTILFAEDNETNIMTIGDYLEIKGYKMIYARSGREALEKADECSPDLILMDIQMPEIDGLEVTRRLRALPRYATTPIIALTAMAMDGDRELCLEAGATDYISKPVRLKQLFSLIIKLLH